MARRARGGRVGDYEHEVLIRSRPRRRFGLSLPYSRRSPAQRVRREEEEQGSGRSFRRQAETEWSGLKVNWPEGTREGGLGHCDDEPPWAKELAARRRRNPLRKPPEAARRGRRALQGCRKKTISS